MSAATNLKRRGSVYYCRRRIPQDLIKHFDGRKELAVSLHTTSLREARLRANDQWRQWEAEFEKLRRGNGAAAMAELTDEQVQALADEHYAGMLKWDEHSREQGLSDEDYEERDAEVALVDSFAPAALAKGDAHRGGYITHLTLKRHGISLPKDSPSHRKLTYALLKATVRANDAVRLRQQGKVVDTPRAPAATLAMANGVNLAGVLEKWAAERAPRSKTKAEWSGIVRDFTKLNGELPLRSIEKAHVVAYKDKLVEAKKAPGTIRTRLAALHSLLEYAMHNDLSERNPAATVRVQTAKSSKTTREHIPIEDLQRLFSSAVFTTGKRPRDDGLDLTGVKHGTS